MAATAPAAAQTEPSNRWVRQTITKKWSGDAVSDRRKSNVQRGEVLYTVSEDTPGLLFQCLAGKLRVGVTFEPQNTAAAFRHTRIYGVSGNGKFVPASKSLTYVDARLGEADKTGLGKWLYFRDRSAALSRARKPAAKLYNAVINGKAITIKASREKEVTLNIPKVNGAFADFGADCGIGAKR